MKRFMVAMKSFGFISVLVFTNVLYAQTPPCDTFEASGDTTVFCDSAPVQLNATAGYDSYSWSPATGLSDSSVANPTASVSATTTYIVTATMGGSNLITNGDFSMGNTDFISGHTFSPFYSPGNYSVGPDFFNLSLSYDIDHTPTADNYFMSVDGIGFVTTLWQTDVTILPNQDYEFSFWCIRVDAVQPDIEIHFIGDVTGDEVLNTVSIIPYAGVWMWDEYSAPVWNSGPNTSVTIRLVNLELDPYGNDFALDDMTLIGAACTAVDTVTIVHDDYVAPPQTTDTSFCSQPGYFIPNAIGNGLTWYANYPGVGTADAPVISTSDPATHTWFVTQQVGTCESDPAEVQVEINASPSVALSPAYVLCEDEIAVIGPLEQNGWQYQWSDGVTESPRIVDQAGTYILSVTNACGTESDTAAVSIKDCNCYFYVPNAITIQGTSSNSLFKPVYDCMLEDYHLTIFDRWGEIIFESYNPAVGWNGTYRNGLVTDGVYVWTIQYEETATSDIITHKGHVTVLK